MDGEHGLPSSFRQHVRQIADGLHVGVYIPNKDVVVIDLRDLHKGILLGGTGLVQTSGIADGEEMFRQDDQDIFGSSVLAVEYSRI